MADAGMDHAKAFLLLGKDNRYLAKTSQSIAKALRKGDSVSKAGQQAGLFTAYDSQLISIADHTGQHQIIYQKLADLYYLKAIYWQRIKAKLSLPIIIFIISIFLAPLPALVLGYLSFIAYLQMTIGFLLKLAISLYLLWKLPNWLLPQSTKDELLIRLPIINSQYIRHQLRDFLQALALMLESGIPILNALPQASKTINNSLLKMEIQQLTLRIKQGASFNQAIQDSPYFDTTIKNFINSGEYSGSLPAILFHYVKMETESIDLTDGQLADWIPKLVYFIVLIWLAKGILAGQ